jgi:hypothetical protein
MELCREGFRVPTAKNRSSRLSDPLELGSSQNGGQRDNSPRCLMFDHISAWGLVWHGTSGSDVLVVPWPTISGGITNHTSQRLGYQYIVAIRNGELPSVHLLSAYCPPTVHLPSN